MSFSSGRHHLVSNKQKLRESLWLSSTAAQRHVINTETAFKMSDNVTEFSCRASPHQLGAPPCCWLLVELRLHHVSLTTAPLQPLLATLHDDHSSGESLHICRRPGSGSGSPVLSVDQHADAAAEERWSGREGRDPLCFLNSVHVSDVCPVLQHLSQTDRFKSLIW